MTSPLSAGEYLADLHVHSRFSRATSSALTLEALHTAAQLKGIRVVATGDATHPAWMAEIEERLLPAEPGLWRLDPRRSSGDENAVPAACRAEVRFMLAAEISLVYKKEGKTRKNHNLVYFPDLSSIKAFSRRLEKIGNIHADGRPILGLDARDLLALTLDTCPEAFLVPAHIWTPWFSVLGAQSGFDSLEECFGDLAGEIFAVETGLSSDPPMNRRVSFLDRVRLISNSDAHSAENLGREANRFSGELSFHGLRDALRGKGNTSFLGTLEFYPEEGKYHYDGHRRCGVRLEPRETLRHGGRCPRCGKMLTVGVLNRVEALADRPEVDPHAFGQGFQHLIPLADILSEILQTGKESRRVAESRRRVLEALGAELVVLCERPASELRALGIPLLDEAVLRMRRGEIEILPGCDGEYGRIRIFREQEREALCGQKALFPAGGEAARRRRSQPPASSGGLCAKKALPEAQPLHPPDPTDEQRAILDSPARRLLITAGPGSGKTHVLTLRIARRIEEGVDACRILAVTFTQKAAAEMRSRLAALLGERGPLPCVATFHGFCLMLLREEDASSSRLHLLHELDQEALVARAIRLAEGRVGPSALRPRLVRSWICAAKEAFLAPEEIFPSFHPEVADLERFRRVYAHYQRLLDSQGLLDLEDILFRVGRRLERDAAWRASCRRRFQEIFVDEYQDLNAAQYRILRSLAPAGAKEPALTVIGDPDQAIYGFRGSTPVYFRNFLQEEPEAEHRTLERNFRSHPEIVAAARRLLGGEPAADGEARRTPGAEAPLRIREFRDESEEARAIAREIRQAIGATGFHEAGAELLPQPERAPRGFRDFAVLTRTSELGEPIAREFARQGIPVQRVDRREAVLGEAARRLLSFLRVGLGLGGLEDFGAAAAFLSPRLPESRLAAFIDWGYRKNLRLAEALQAAGRFPVTGLRPSDQRLLLQGIQALQELRREAAGKSPREALRLLLHHEWVRRAGAEAAVAAAAERFEELLAGGAPSSSAEGILETLVLAADGDLYREAAQKVALMTLHASKGLEFPVVFIAACEEGVLPWADAACEERRQEELRLLYVGLTRAKDQVVLSWAKRRLIRGKRLERRPSPFLARLGDGLVERASPSAPPRRPTPRQRSLFGDP